MGTYANDYKSSLLSGGTRSLWGQPDRLRWCGYSPVTWPVPSQPGVGHLLSFFSPLESENKDVIGRSRYSHSKPIPLTCWILRDNIYAPVTVIFKHCCVCFEIRHSVRKTVHPIDTFWDRVRNKSILCSVDLPYQLSMEFLVAFLPSDGMQLIKISERKYNKDNHNSMNTSGDIFHQIPTMLKCILG